MFSGIGANLFFILTVSLLSWYHWSDSVWVEETRLRLRNRAEESRRRKRAEMMSPSGGDVSSTFEGSSKSFDDDEDISIIEEKPLHRSLIVRSDSDDSDDIEELSGYSGETRQRKTIPKIAGESSA